MYTVNTKLTVTVAKVGQVHTAIYRVGALDTDIKKTVNETVFNSLLAKGADLARWSDPLPGITKASHE